MRCGSAWKARGAGTAFKSSPYYVNSALYPIILVTLSGAKVRSRRDGGVKLTSEALLVTHYGRPNKTCASLLLCSIPCEERYGALAMTPQKHKEETCGRWWTSSKPPPSSNPR